MIYIWFKNHSPVYFFFIILMFQACSSERNTRYNDNYYKLDFESIYGWSTLYSGFLEKNESYAGNYCLHVTGDLEYCGNYKNMISSIKDWPVPFVNVGAWVKSQTSLPGTFLVVAVYDTIEKQNKFYKLIEFDKFFTKSGDWYHVADRVILTTDNKDSYEFSIYIWNKSKNDFLIDDIELELSKS